MTNKYNVLYLVKEIARQFPTFGAILVYKHHMISYFLLLASKPYSQLDMWTKGKTLQDILLWEVSLAKLTAKIVSKMHFRIIFLWKRDCEGEGESHGNKVLLKSKKHQTPDYWTQNFTRSQDELLLKSFLHF